ncbi:MAG: hypothetical protein ACR2QE_16585 [Acidimicrobiales bacterium]
MGALRTAVRLVVMHTRPVHTRLALLAVVVVLAATSVGFLAFQRATARADSVSDTAALVAVSLDDQALVVALQHERWQQLRGEDLDGARGATDALIEVRDFDAQTLELIDAARSSDAQGGYDAALNHLLNRSGHVDPSLLDGSDAARASVNAGLLHWRQALVDELEAVLGRSDPDLVDEARAVTGDWSTTLRLSAAPGQDDVIAAATGSDVLVAHRSSVDSAGPGDRSVAATAAWDQSHVATATIVADADAAIWSHLVAARDDARLQAQLTPLVVAAAALVALLGLFWVGRRWPAAVVDVGEVGLETLVSIDPDDPEVDDDGEDDVRSPDDVDTTSDSDTTSDDDEVFDDEPDDEPDDEVDTDPARTSEPIFAGAQAAPIAEGETDDPVYTEIFAEQSRREPVVAPTAAPGVPVGDQGFVGVIAAAAQQSLRPIDVTVDTVDPGGLTGELGADLTTMVTTLIDSALAHATPDVPVTVIGSTHELGYLVWVIDDGARIDDDRRDQLNRALGGVVSIDDRSTLLHRLIAVGERAGATGIDIEIFADHEGGNIARLFVPGRHLISEPATPESATVESVATTDPVPMDTPRADPLASSTAERLSARLARQASRGRTPESSPATNHEEPARVHRPEPVRPEPRTDPSRAWPVSGLGPVPLSDGVGAENLTDAQRRAAVARRLVEQYRGGVTAALMDAADDIVLVRRTEDRS